MNRIKNTLAAIALAVMASCAPAYAQSQCGASDDVYSALAEKYGEDRHSYGTVPDGIVETWVNDVTGSWTIVVTTPSGVSCIVAAGQGFERTVRGNV